jgi:hypothetical protein
MKGEKEWKRKRNKKLVSLRTRNIKHGMGLTMKFKTPNSINAMLNIGKSQL